MIFKVQKGLSNNCNETFEPSFDENLQVIQNYPKGVTDRYFPKIGGNKSKPDMMVQFPVFVTAMDYTYYPFCQGMFFSLHAVLNSKRNRGKSRIIVYDLGLSERQLTVLRKKCRCEIRRFPFEMFPPHVRNLKTYAFKPLIIQMTLMEFGFVWWADTSVKIVRFNLDDAINYAKKNSVLFFVERDYPIRYSIARQTDVRTFNYLEEGICKFRSFGEVWATTVLFHFDDITKAVVNAWASCALNEACIAPVGKEKLSCDLLDINDGRCHRFDQSVLGIILRRLYHEQNEYPLDKKLNKIYSVGRREFVNYFERCRSEYACY
ncbi:uncharacterized protein LOC128557406 [Mercenaria mercenaria]|uniref:uncharacterized protein LOC128557406 n=1 Tax=Mercenaria mercenaria TaxID=6596 RepID=UPI00234EED27|nr:uncharacterized protein LOC128557406 [Mercenaria mercenaria]